MRYGLLEPKLTFSTELLNQGFGNRTSKIMNDFTGRSFKIYCGVSILFRSVERQIKSSYVKTIISKTVHKEKRFLKCLFRAYLCFIGYFIIFFYLNIC